MGTFAVLQYFIYLEVILKEKYRGPGTREKVSSSRINLECNIYVQESNASQLSV
jgi:hypothetical protein